MSAIICYKVTCPECGHQFGWSNGGGIIVSLSQLIPVCPYCKHNCSVINDVARLDLVEEDT
jgi:NAD-dependent SIR2 family protein deacetylase